MPTIGSTPRPAYVYDAQTDTWVPVGVTPHTHTSAISDVTGLQASLDSKAAASSVPAFVAGKNKIINGDFGIWQRGTTVNVSAGVTTYLADRFSVYMDTNAGTVSYSRQSFAPGTAPVAGYEGQYFARVTTGGSCNLGFSQFVEDVRTFAGQTVTLSFWAKASTARTITMKIMQLFGTGGSATTDAGFVNYNVTTSWQRFSGTFNIPSVAGKTIGTNSALLVRPVDYQNFNANIDLDFWGVMAESGSVATPFTTATGTLQGEQAAARRYTKSVAGTNPLMSPMSYLTAFNNSYSQTVFFDVPLRVNPTITFTDNASTSGRVTAYTEAGSMVNNLTPNFNFIGDGTGAVVGLRWSVPGNYAYSEVYNMIISSEL